MANLTLAIDDDLLRRARIRALEEGTSVNAIVREHLAAYVHNDTPSRTMQRFVDSAAEHPATGTVSGDRTWARADLYGERLGK